MIKGLLVYTAIDAKKNMSFIAQCMQAALKYNIDLTLVTDEHPIDLSVDFVWNRSRNSHISKQYERQHILVFNRAAVCDIANNKRMAIECVTLLDIPTIPLYLRSKIPSFPIVAKTMNGHGGNEVFLCETEEHLQRIEQQFNEPLLIQPLIATNATDVRVFLLGNTILGAIKRIGTKGDFRSNFTLGGSIEKYTLTATQHEQILKIQRALKSDYVGIDFLLLEDGSWVFNEIEDPVGARSYYELYNTDLPEKIMQHFTTKLLEMS